VQYLVGSEATVVVYALECNKMSESLMLLLAGCKAICAVRAVATIIVIVVICNCDS
jgi:hypothetical protein